MSEKTLSMNGLSPSLSTQDSALSTDSSTQHSSLSTQYSKKWLITGGCGFIGRNLIKALLAEGGHHIRIIDNLSVGTKEDLKQVCDFTEINLSTHRSSLSTSSPLSTQNPSLALDPSLSTQDSGLRTNGLSHRSSLSTQNSVLRTNGLNSSLSTQNSDNVELIVGDILSADLALKVTEGIDVIIHLAANTGVGPSVENPRKDCETNVIGTFNYLEAARQNNVKRFIFASSGAPVGECNPPIHEELAPHPVSPYGASKLAGEGYCSAYYRTFGLETVALRFGNVYGPLSGHKSSAVAKFIRQAMNGETIEIYGDGTQTRDFIYADDLISAILKAATLPMLKHSKLSTQNSALSTNLCPDPSLSTQYSELSTNVLSQNSNFSGGETFQIATNSETTIGELVDLLLPILSEFGINNVKVTNAKPRLGDVLRNFSDTSKAKSILGWSHEVDLPEGLKRTVECFLETQHCTLRTRN